MKSLYAQLSSISDNSLGMLCAVLAALCFSTNDVTIKFLSGGYALHQIILIRALIGLALLIALVAFSKNKFAIFKTKHLAKHILRGACVVFANMSFFLALAAMPLTDAVAIYFISPIIITLFSIVFLKEQVGPHRWLATVVGFMGVLIMVQPGTDNFHLAYLLPMVAATAFAALHILTRSMRETESAATMTFYIQLTFIVVCLGMGLSVGDGRYAVADSPSLYFLLRPWGPIDLADLYLFIIIGFTSTFGGYLISQAYRKAEAGLAAPFEYIALPLSIVWGISLFNEWPNATDLIGISLILASGLYTMWREVLGNKRLVIATPQRR